MLVAAEFSGSLPNVPVNTIVYENVSETNRVYIGTDIGVFTKDNLAADWEPYMTGLPNVMIHELAINYSDSKLYAATYKDVGNRIYTIMPHLH